MAETQQTYVSEKVRNSSNVVINPATEEKQDDIITNQTNGTQKTQIIWWTGNVALVNSLWELNIVPQDVTWWIQHHGEIEWTPATIFNIMGARSRGWGSTTILGDCCEYLNTSQNLMNTPTSWQTLYLVSTSVNDTAAWTGVRTVRIVYLDSTWLQQFAIFTLNGTTPVSIGSGYTFIQWMESASVWSNNTAVWDVTISSINGVATVATTFEMIDWWGNRSLSGRYKVPSDSHVHMLNWSAAAISNTMDTRLKADTFSDNGLSAWVFHFKDRIFLASGQNFVNDLHYEAYPANTVIKVSAIPWWAWAGNKLDVHFTFILMSWAD